MRRPYSPETLPTVLPFDHNVIMPDRVLYGQVPHTWTVPLSYRVPIVAVTHLNTAGYLSPHQPFAIRLPTLLRYVARPGSSAFLPIPGSVLVRFDLTRGRVVCVQGTVRSVKV